MKITVESSLEQKLLRRLNKGKISSASQFQHEVLKVFEAICGSHGRKEFEESVIPGLIDLYGNDFKSAGFKALEIIDEGASKKPTEIGDYFRMSVQKVERPNPQKAPGASKTKVSKPQPYMPQYRKRQEFSPLRNQDRLNEGLLRTKNGDYIPMSYLYALEAGGKHYLFKCKSEQDKLGRGLIGFSVFEIIGLDPTLKDKYFPIDEITKMKGKVEEPAGCFVATAVYGNPEAPQVEALRQFRDDVLMQNPVGRAFVNFYYSGAREMTANFIRQHTPSAIPPIRKGLDLLVETYSARKEQIKH